MSQRAILAIEILSYWHPGTGRGDGVGADAVVNATADGLPTIPGRTLKGLLRHAVEQSAEAGVTIWNGDSIADAFGSAITGASGEERVDALEASRFATRPGKLRVDSALLGKSAGERLAWIESARAEGGAALTAAMRTTISSTALEAGLARDGSLRSTEAWLPVTLYAELSWEPGEARDAAPWAGLNEAAQLFLRSLGSGRNRGLGRCHAYIVEGGFR
jgi:hypothetical protein